MASIRRLSASTSYPVLPPGPTPVPRSQGSLSRLGETAVAFHFAGSVGSKTECVPQRWKFRCIKDNVADGQTDCH